ncbi:MAG: hypothetical protein COB67_12455 [SAR324 cluster bacterium]|uniref:Uncharacterized protein n=1 Tax=SAR324 cluster bacterium TaxID=2024889 RepID=A0A2A4SRG2_9DELT|nr:MAG: hypothetical protein COB67_12455 [SAR324 cluster bacterium]
MYKSFKVSFPDFGEITIFLDNRELSKKVPGYAKFCTKNCGARGDSDIHVDFCSLAVRLKPILEYFNHTQSIDRGELIIFEKSGREVKVQDDAQTLFLYSFWLSVLCAPCSIFYLERAFLRYYNIEFDEESLFYSLLSIFVMRRFLKGEKEIRFQDFDLRLHQLKKVFSGLIDRLTPHLKTDTVRNGLIKGDHLLQLIELDVDELIEKLKVNNIS